MDNKRESAKSNLLKPKVSRKFFPSHVVRGLERRDFAVLGKRNELFVELVPHVAVGDPHLEFHVRILLALAPRDAHARSHVRRHRLRNQLSYNVHQHEIRKLLGGVGVGLELEHNAAAAVLEAVAFPHRAEPFAEVRNHI